VVAALHRSIKPLSRALEELKSTWPSPGDEGMGSISEAAGLSERDAVPGGKAP